MSTTQPQLRDYVRSSYTAADLDRLTTMLHEQGTFNFPRLDSGLFPAAVSGAPDLDYTGYDNVWVRDNIQIAHAHWLIGKNEVAVDTVRALMKYFLRYRKRIDDVNAGIADHTDPMNRPHIRFRGSDLSEIDEKWAHAQNDALGYLMWLYSKLAASRELTVDPAEFELLTALAWYLETIKFWQDEDSGHWEENRKISASSIGVATAGLAALGELLESDAAPAIAGSAHLKLTDRQRVAELVAKGRTALAGILPAECNQADPSKARRYDSALLFLIWPTRVVDDAMADRILADVIGHLGGEHGIRRYIGDSYWCADYKTLLPPEERTADFSDDLSKRDRLLKPGAEAQWCIFDPVISIIYGERFQRSPQPADLERQTHFLNRSLGQLTKPGGRFPPLRCPESYYLEAGRYVPNDITPLLWTQANLAVALKSMRTSCELAQS
jgi:phosphorylase kinase alpha/beta subunit